jgi:hypothetical protein
MSEREFQAHVVAGLEHRGYIVWHVTDSRLMRAGLPDILAYHPKRPGHLLVWELKRERGGVVTTEQRAAIEHFRTMDGIDARVVRPSDWAEISKAL